MNGSPLRLLVVDDDPNIRHLVVRYAQRHDACGAVVPASNITEARKIAALHQPDVIILDVHLAGESGIDAIPAVRDVAPGARIVMFSNDPTCRQPALDTGADSWCDKSDGFNSLVREALDPNPTRTRQASIGGP